MTVSAAMGCKAAKPERRKASDFYPTPPDFTRALLEAERDFIIGRVWEPAAGEGHIVKVLEALGYDVVASDLVDRGCPGVIVENYLNFEESLGQSLITNPPYGSKLPERFVRHALKLRIGYVALFLKANYFNTIDRLRLYADWPPVAIYPMTWRPDWTGGGSPTMDMTWYVWDVRRAGTFLFKPLKKPVNENAAPKNLELFGGVAA